MKKAIKMYVLEKFVSDIKKESIINKKTLMKTFLKNIVPSLPIFFAGICDMPLLRPNPNMEINPKIIPNEIFIKFVYRQIYF